MTIRFGLGIDAGGTFTDAVVIDLTTGKVVSANKAITTPVHPSVGIEKALSRIDPDLLRRVSMVSLATTFATNAIVEDRAGEAGLILIGYEERPVAISSNAQVLMVRGGHTVRGEEKAPLDRLELERKLPGFVSGLDAVAVAGFFSVRNPDHEIKVSNFIREQYALPVVRGHRLSMRLDAMKRATTAWWNARLIPIINDLIRDVKTVLEWYKVSAPLMVVRGDGTLMSAETALDRPVDTLLSGPGASILGAKHLSGLENALIVDMGGTTTDMAALVDGKVDIDPQGASVGKWHTHVQAAKVRTIGIGGDSFIRLNRNKQLLVGPRRVVPLCILAEQHPEIIDMLNRIRQLVAQNYPIGVNPAVFYYPSGRHIASGTKGIPTYLRSGPVSEFLLCAQTSHLFCNWELEQLERQGLVFRSALTPTDVWVAMQNIDYGHRDAARLGTEIFATRCQVDVKSFVAAVEREIGVRLCKEAIRLVDANNCAALLEMADQWYGNSELPIPGVGLDVRVSLMAPVIGVGAPAKVCLSGVFAHLNTDCVIPQDFAVSVAVGSVVGMVDVTFTAKVIPTESGRHILHTDAERREFPTEAGAVDYGRHYLETLAKERMARDHVQGPLVDFKIKRKAVSTQGGEDMLLETQLLLRATGRPDVGRVAA